MGNETPALPGTEPTDQRVKECVRIAKARFQDHGMALRTIAPRLGVSPDYLGKLFSKTVGISFRKYLLGLRMQAAARVLRQGGSEKEAAFAAGYIHSDLPHFVRAFRRWSGATPRNWLGTPGQTENPSTSNDL